MIKCTGKYCYDREYTKEKGKGSFKGYTLWICKQCGNVIKMEKEVEEEGERCSGGAPYGQYLRNRLELAFIAGATWGLAQSRNLKKQKKYEKSIKRSEPTC